MKKNAEALLFYLLRLGLNTEEPVNVPHHEISINWREVIEQGVRHGVGVIQFDGLQASYAILGRSLQMPDKGDMMSWYAHTLQIEQRCAQQYTLASELTKLYQNNGIRTIVLKGIAAGQNYPIPNHRPCGDFDCFLMDDYERGNSIARNAGVKVDDSYYIHSKIQYKELTVENHQYCTTIRRGRKAKEFERLLHSLLKDSMPCYIGDTAMEIAPTMFNALFLTYHAKKHFVSEGIALRHLTDWAMLLHHHNDDINWQDFRDICREYDYDIFADAMTRLSRKLLHINVPKTYHLENDDRRDHFLLEEIMTDRRNQDDGGIWMQRVAVFKTIFNNRRRYDTFSRGTYLKYIVQLVSGFFFDRNPKL